MPELLDPSEIMFTPFEPKTKNRYIMYIEGIPAYLIKTANRPSIAFETIELDHINVKRYIKGKGALSDVDTFTIKNGKNGCEVIIGYSSTNTNRVNIPVECDIVFDLSLNFLTI